MLIYNYSDCKSLLILRLQPLRFSPVGNSRMGINNLSSFE